MTLLNPTGFNDLLFDTADNSNNVLAAEDDGFEIFDPRGLFSPQRHPSQEKSISADLTDLVQDHRGFSSPASNSISSHHHHQPTSLNSLSPSKTVSPTLDLSPIHLSTNVDENLPLGLSLRHHPWSTSNLHQSSSSTLSESSKDHPTVDTDIRTLGSHSIHSRPTHLSRHPMENSFNIPSESDPTPTMSPFESPISPCSSLPFGHSPPTNLSMSHSLSLNRGRSPPPGVLSDAPSVQSPLEINSSLSPPRLPTSSARSHLSSSAHRPAPIITSGVRDLSLPSRLSHIRSPDFPCSVSSHAYSDMESSPAVNFLSAFADATIPTAKTEISPVPTVPSDVLEEGDKMNNYILGPIIGRGGFSVVREACHQINHQRVAVKIVRRVKTCTQTNLPAPKSFSSKPISLHASLNSRDRSSSVAMLPNRHLVNSTHLPLPTSVTEDLAAALLKQEIRIWSGLSHHPNIVPLLSLYETPNHTLLFMPICEGGNLLQFINRVKLDPSEQDKLYQILHCSSDRSVPSSPCLSQSGPPPGSGGLRLDLVRPIFSQIVQGLKYLHKEAGIVHKDIKLENILIHNRQIKISDFGLATYPLSDRPPEPFRTVKSKASSSCNRDLSLPKHFSALPRITEGRVAEASSKAISWSQSHLSRSRLPTALDNSALLSQPVKEDDMNDSIQQGVPLPLNGMVPTAAGSLAYTPPEQLRSEMPLACPSLDIWALGCVLYGLLEGHLPFEDDFEPRLRLKIMNGQFESPSALAIIPEQISEIEADDRMMIAKVLKGCLAVDRNARWMVEEIATSVWLAPQPLRNSSLTSDDGQSSDCAFDQLSISKRTNSCNSSVPSVWSMDEISLEPSNRMTSPVAPYVESESIESNLEGFSPTLPFSLPDTCTSPPLIRKDLLDLRKLLTPILSSSPSRSSEPINDFILQSHHTVQSPPLPGFERLARSRHRSASDRHQSHSRLPPPKVSICSSKSNSRSRSRNRK